MITLECYSDETDYDYSQLRQLNNGSPYLIFKKSEDESYLIKYTQFTELEYDSIVDEEFDGDFDRYFRYYAEQVAEVFQDNAADELRGYLDLDKTTKINGNVLDIQIDGYFIEYIFQFKLA